jgi:hypothetical protein
MITASQDTFEPTSSSACVPGLKHGSSNQILLLGNLRTSVKLLILEIRNLQRLTSSPPTGIASKMQFEKIIYIIGRIPVPFRTAFENTPSENTWQCKILWGYALLRRKFGLSYTGPIADIFPRTHGEMKNRKPP